MEETLNRKEEGQPRPDDPGHGKGEELAQDPRFNSIGQRAENHHALNELVADWVKRYDLKEVTEIL